MTGPVITRAEMRAFVLALMDVETKDWWLAVILDLPTPVRMLINCAMRYDDGPHGEMVECLSAAADLLRPRWTREEAEQAWEVAHDQSEWRSGDERVIRMITGEEP
jgi:hypothetical protein